MPLTLCLVLQVEGASMVGGMSSILRELAEVQHQLVSLSKDAEEQKYALLARQ